MARFAHKYDVPHALQHVAAYLTGFMVASKNHTLKNAGSQSVEEVITWAVIADKFDLQALWPLRALAAFHLG